MVSIIEIGKTWCSASGKLLSSVELKEIPAPTSPSVCLLHYPPPLHLPVPENSPAFFGCRNLLLISRTLHRMGLLGNMITPSDEINYGGECPCLVLNA